MAEPGQPDSVSMSVSVSWISEFSVWLCRRAKAKAISLKGLNRAKCDEAGTCTASAWVREVRPRRSCRRYSYSWIGNSNAGEKLRIQDANRRRGLR